MRFSIETLTPERGSIKHVLFADGEELPISLNDEEVLKFPGDSVELFRLISILQHPTTDRANTLLDWLKQRAASL